MLLAEKKKKMEICLKLFSILTELTDYKIEQYKWFDINKSNNLYNITKLVQNLDLLPLYFIHNCGIIYHSKANENDPNNLNNIASYMYFIQKLGLLYNYNDIYPDVNKDKNRNNEKYIIIHQDSFSRVNFNVLNLTEKKEKILLEENNIFIIFTDNFDEYLNRNSSHMQDKFKIFFVVTKISENLFKIQRKYNSKKKEEINYINIDEFFLNEFIIDIENQSSFQLIINMIKSIDILIKTNLKNVETNKSTIDFMGKNKESEEMFEKGGRKRGNSMILNNQDILINDDYVNTIENSDNNLSNFERRINYIDEKELWNDNNESSLKKRYQLMCKL